MEVVQKLRQFACNSFKSSVTACFLGCMLCFFHASTLQAQHKNNAYNIDDECYRYMRKATRFLGRPVVLNMCDTLRLMAQRKQDVKAECISYSIRAIHYSQTNDTKLIQEFPKYKSFIEKTPYLQYLYTIWCNLIEVYDKTKQLEMCFQEIDKMRKDATARNNYFGLAKSYNKVANLYSNRMNWQSAIANLERAYQILADNKDKNVYQTEIQLATCYDKVGRIEESKKYFKQGLSHTPKAYEKSSLTFYLVAMNAHPQYYSNEEHEEIANRLIRYHSYNRSTSEDDNYYSAITDHYLQRGRYAEALVYTDSIKRRKIKFRNKSLIYEEMGKWDSAYVYMKERFNNARTEWESTNTDFLAKATASIDSSHLALEKNQILINQLRDHQHLLELQSQQHLLQLKNTDLELANKNNDFIAQQQKLRLIQSENEVNKLNLKNEEQLNRQRELEHKIREEQRLRESRSLYSILIVLILTLLVSLYVIRLKNKKNKQIAQEKAIAIEAQKRAERADNLKSVFLQNMSHEIRTPLNAIVGFSEVLTTPEIADAMEAEERDEMSHLIQVNSNLLLTLVNDILDLSKLESGTYQMIRTDVDVHKLCGDTLQSVKGREQAGVTLALQLPQTPVTLHTDKQRVQQVLINFLTNACKNTSSGRITLGYEPVSIAGKPYLRFFVEDTGCGIPKDKIDSVFNRFEKLDIFKQGTGLGLNICRLICKMVGGNIYVDPSYSNGARFVFEHPF